MGWDLTLRLNVKNVRSENIYCRVIFINQIGIYDALRYCY